MSKNESEDGKHYSGSEMYEMVVALAPEEARKRRKSIDEAASEIIKGKAYRKG